MATSKKSTKSNQQDDFLRIQDLIGLCIAKWYWFVLSLGIAFCIATYNILKAVPVYQRSASLLIKDDTKKSSTIASNSNAFSNMGIFATNTNVYNEIYSIKSPALMLEVVKRLHLDMNYYQDGRWHKAVLYGNVLPIAVSIEGLADHASCSFKVSFDKQGNVVMSDFVGGSAQEDSPSLKTQFDKKVQTPVGNVTIARSPYYAEGSEGEIEVVRSNIYGTTSSCLGKLSVGLTDEETTIINLTYTDQSTQRAEEVLNTLISVYNENWVKDKNQIAVSTSEFINDRLNVIERELGNVDTDISSYKSEQQVPDLGAAANLALQESSVANANITNLNNQVYMAKYIRSNLQNSAANNKLLPANSGIENAQLSAQIEEYNSKLLQRNSLVANSSEENPLVQDYDATLASMRHNIESSIDNQIASLNEQIRGQQAIGGRAVAQMSSNPKQAKYLLSVERQQKVKEALYMFLLQKREENELSQAFTAYNTRLVMPPTGANAPIAPRTRNIYLIALAAGLLLPIVLLFIQENMNTKVRGRKDIESLTVPIVGEVPMYGRNKEK
ncbi:MAG: chromosome partitioning protein ParA, partial [Bacteroidaceae bacterium]|nr:chromosome partitioning protein ParA [Bacteroidaceae bacterium]